MQNIRTKLNSLPKRHKGLLIGLAISTLALLLPWYSDIDSYKSGISYMAINGPAALIGITALLVNLFGTFVILSSLISKKDFTNRRLIENLLAPIYFYCSLVLISIYFHPDFGLNVTQKTLSFGAYIGIFGAFVMTYSTIVFKKEDLSHVNPHTVEDVLTKDHPELKETWEQQKNIEQKILERSAKRVADQDREHKTNFKSDSLLNADNAFGNKRRNDTNSAQEIIDKHQNKGSFMYREDL